MQIGLDRKEHFSFLVMDEGLSSSRSVKICVQRKSSRDYRSSFFIILHCTPLALKSTWSFKKDCKGYEERKAQFYSFYFFVAVLS